MKKYSVLFIALFAVFVGPLADIASADPKPASSAKSQVMIVCAPGLSARGGCVSGTCAAMCIIGNGGMMSGEFHCKSVDAQNATQSVDVQGRTLFAPVNNALPIRVECRQ